VDHDVKPPLVRIEEALREIAVLLVALSPLDVAFGPERAGAMSNLLIFLGAGATLFGAVLLAERRRHNVSTSHK
jgi:hypothetical protein